MNKIFLFCCAVTAMTAVLFSSCDKDASNVKLERITGTYTGNVEAYLYVPDYDVERENMYWYNKDGIPAIAGDTATQGRVQFNFATDNLATISIDTLKDIQFEVSFMEESEGMYFVRDIYSEGILAKVFEEVQAALVKKTVNTHQDSVDFKEFADQLVNIKENLLFTDIKTNSLRMRENGAIYTTYDYEQNSLYERLTLEPFKFKRESSIEAAMVKLNKIILEPQYAYLKDNAYVKQIMGMPLEGTVSDASGWCALAYSNYSPNTEFTIKKATGLIDVMSMALFGDENNDQTPDKTLWLVMYYGGTPGDMSSYHRVEEKK